MPYVRIKYLLWKQYILLRFDGENFDDVSSTKFSHIQTLGLAKYREQPLTTGSYGYEPNSKTEIMNLVMGQWEDGPDYPYQEL